MKTHLNYSETQETFLLVELQTKCNMICQKNILFRRIRNKKYIAFFYGKQEMHCFLLRGEVAHTL